MSTGVMVGEYRGQWSSRSISIRVTVGKSMGHVRQSVSTGVTIGDRE